jgi:RHS repeat-associated protein
VKKVSNAETAEAKRGLQSGYGYDLIGNRIMDKQHTPSSGSGLSEAVWTANELNQITARENHSSRWVFGHVKQAASLTVTGNSGPVIREGDEFAVPVSRTGAATDADWHSLDVTATLAGVGRVVNGTPLDVTTQRQGKVWFPTSPESLQYDDDGNSYQDGRWQREWNAENRLIRAETRADVAAATGMPRERLEMAYDAMGRRIRKAVYRLENLNSQPATWVLKSDLRFLYEGTSWNLVAELNLKPDTSNLELVRSYAWGTDISGNATGAGGVGGLLLVNQESGISNQESTTAPCYDGNGNVSAYVRVQSGTVSSRHDYDAFGRPVWSELEGTGGRQVAASPFGFSTKYTDVETGWVYYGFRYYAPEMGRWLNRDPIRERGGLNLYRMVGNDPVNRWDLLGNYPGAIGPEKPNCEVILLISHGPYSTERYYKAWIDSVTKLAAKYNAEEDLVLNGEHPFYGSIGIVACHQPAKLYLWTPGVKGNPPIIERDPTDSFGRLGPGWMGPPDPTSPYAGGHVGPSNRLPSDEPIYRKTGSPFTNGGFGHTNQAYLDYVRASLDASLKHGSDLADQCKKDACCRCDSITVRFIVDFSNSTRGAGGNNTLNDYNAYAGSKEAERFNNNNPLQPADYPGLDPNASMEALPNVGENHDSLKPGQRSFFFPIKR